ncbi:MAG: hypothetical protein EZS26_003388, partial [Candidatus Ordinivivax streblomastigis]
DSTSIAIDCFSSCFFMTINDKFIYFGTKVRVFSHTIATNLNLFSDFNATPVQIGATSYQHSKIPLFYKTERAKTSALPSFREQLFPIRSPNCICFLSIYARKNWRGRASIRLTHRRPFLPRKPKITNFPSPIRLCRVESVWKKEDELKGLKGEMTEMERKIEASLKPIEQSVGIMADIPKEEAKPLQIPDR